MNSYSLEDIKSAHDKQRRWYMGEGGVKFTEMEKKILDEGVLLPEEKDAVGR